MYLLDNNLLKEIFLLNFTQNIQYKLRGREWRDIKRTTF